MNTIKEFEPMKGITGKYIAKRYKGGTLDKVEPLEILAKNYKRRAAWLENTVLASLSKRWLRKALELEEKAENILQANFLGIAAESDNLVVSQANHGRNLVCQRLAGVNTYSLNITHLEMGTSGSSPLVGDTDLNAAVAKTTLANYSIANNVVTLRFFLNDALLPNGTYREMGTFIDGTATLGVGQMWNHALFTSPYVKATGEDTTIELVITVN